MNISKPSARLVGFTQPDWRNDKEQLGQLSELETAEDLIAYCARVSNPSNQVNKETGEKLIRYLVKHKHWSPLEMASATIEVSTTRDIARQFLRHRSFSFQEFSQRYADPRDMDDTFVLREARLQDTKNRQNSVETDDEQLAKSWAMKQAQIIFEAKMAYKWAIDNGIAKEQARAVLPEGNTKSVVIANGTLRSWVHYIELRTANGTQKEHIELAQACAVEVAKVFPMIEEFIE
jgi:thymidylate synthase (FAD)